MHKKSRLIILKCRLLCASADRCRKYGGDRPKTQIYKKQTTIYSCGEKCSVPHKVVMSFAGEVLDSLWGGAEEKISFSLFAQ